MGIRNSFSYPRSLNVLELGHGSFYTAAQMAVWSEKKGFFQRAIGCSIGNIFDLASLTKVLCTTTIWANLRQKKPSILEQSLEYFSKNSGNLGILKTLKIENLLRHNSGLPAWNPLYTQNEFYDLRLDPELVDSWDHQNFSDIFNPKTSDSMIKRIERIAEIYLNSAQRENGSYPTRYSDLGFLLLGWILEVYLQKSLRTIFNEFITVKMKMIDPTFDLQFQTDQAMDRSIPTGWSTVRNKRLKGEINDDNAALYSGVAGHAGLLGSAFSVCQLGLQWLPGRENVWSLSDQDKHAFFKHDPSQRPLGWDAVSGSTPAVGRFFSKTSVGHLGFTGTSLWLDPEHRIVAVLLTNRTIFSEGRFPSALDRLKFQNFRAQFHDALFQDLMESDLH